MTKKWESGQSLVETIAALGVVVIIIFALISITTISIRNATFAKNQALATKYAQKSIEEARELRDRYTGDFFDTGSSVYSDCISPGLPPSPFTLTRDCDLETPDRMMVQVTASWTDAKGDHQSELTTYLTRW